MCRIQGLEPPLGTLQLDAYVTPTQAVCNALGLGHAL